MNTQTFKTYVNGLRATRRLPPPTETELKGYLSALKARNITLYWGNESFPKHGFELRFMHWTKTNTPYLSYFVRALHEITKALDVVPAKAVKLDVKKGRAFTEEKYVILHTVNQREIALWILKNHEKLSPQLRIFSL
ncbi:MAG: hypothetical protein U9R38_04885 [Candidatus Margulisiibacteriota bacterium]|nr:hypothetical protein [Candidatus Margulisiibacteriota bacterium]